MKELEPSAFSKSHLDRLQALNALRAEGPSPPLDELERQFETEFACSRHLAVYGSLAPGRSNAAQLEDLAGEWLADCVVTGELVHSCWGDEIGYPALRWSAAGPSVPVQLFVSADLPRHWARLDEFEGSDYRRIVVPVLRADLRIVALANIYATLD